MKYLRNVTKKAKAALVPGSIIGIAAVFAFGPVSDTVTALTTTQVELVSINNTGDGQGGNSDSSVSGSTSRTISADGMFIPFNTVASNIVSNDTNGKNDVFVRDLRNDVTIRVSVSSNGTESNADSTFFSISETGRYVVYRSAATTLEAGGDGNPSNKSYIYIHDIKTGSNRSVTTPGWNQNLATVYEVSNDGRLLVGTATPPGAPSSRVVMYDMSTNAWSRLALPQSGGEELTYQDQPVASCDGSFVAFRSSNTNLTTSDNNGTHGDIFLVDLRNGNKIVNLTHNFNGHSSEPRISCNGNYITFKSTATDIDPNFSSLTGSNYYRYDRIDNNFSLVNQDTNGAVLYTSFVRHITDSGRVIFSANYYSQIGYPNYLFIREEYDNETEVVVDHLNGQQLRYDAWGLTVSGMDKDGKIFMFSSTRTDLIASDTNGKRDVFVSKLD